VPSEGGAHFLLRAFRNEVADASGPPPVARTVPSGPSRGPASRELRSIEGRTLASELLRVHSRFRGNSNRALQDIPPHSDPPLRGRQSLARTPRGGRRTILASAGAALGTRSRSRPHRLVGRIGGSSPKRSRSAPRPGSKSRSRSTGSAPDRSSGHRPDGAGGSPGGAPSPHRLVHARAAHPPHAPQAPRGVMDVELTRKASRALGRSSLGRCRDRRIPADHGPPQGHDRGRPLRLDRLDELRQPVLPVERRSQSQRAREERGPGSDPDLRSGSGALAPDQSGRVAQPAVEGKVRRTRRRALPFADSSAGMADATRRRGRIFL